MKIHPDVKRYVDDLTDLTHSWIQLNKWPFRLLPEWAQDVSKYLSTGIIITLVLWVYVGLLWAAVAGGTFYVVTIAYNLLDGNIG